MTILSDQPIDISDIDYKVNDIKYALANNDPLEEKLHVIIVVSNPSLYKRRYTLLKEFVQRIEMEETHVLLYVVELVYGEQPFMVTNKNNPQHLQLQTDTAPIWHKENLINLGVRDLLPKTYKAFAWIDADIEFESSTWALDTLKILNGCKDVVQLFSHAVDMSREETSLNLFNGFGYSFTKKKTYCTMGLDYWHPGFAWAMTRRAYESVGGIYERGVLGSGDTIMAMAFIKKAIMANNKAFSAAYNQSMLAYEINASKQRLGYVPGVIRHHYHGTKVNRKYTERWKLLMKYQYSPLTDLIYDEKGLLTPNPLTFKKEFKEDIRLYFAERKEDD